MADSSLVTPEEAQRIGQEVRADFRAAVAKTERLGTELNALGRSAKPSPAPSGPTALKAVREVR